MRSLEKRLAAMGGVPALGGVVLPRLTPAAKAGLQPTASPAAIELRQEPPPGGSPLPPPPRPGPSPPHRYLLRKTPTGAGAGAQGGAVMSELEAALQRRKAGAPAQEDGGASVEGRQ
jgi:hypothetical protein